MRVDIQVSRDFQDAIAGAQGILSNTVILTNIYRSMNEVLKFNRTAAIKGVKSQFPPIGKEKFKEGETNPYVKVFMGLARKEKLEATFSVKGRTVTLGRYGKTTIRKFGKQSKAPQFQVNRSPNSIDGSFAIANASLPNKPNAFNQGKGYQIVSRIGGNGGKRVVQMVVPKKGRYAGKVYVRGPMKGQPYRRQPINLFRNIAIPVMFNTKEQNQIVNVDLMAKQFNDRLISKMESSFKSLLKRNSRLQFE